MGLPSRLSFPQCLPRMARGAALLRDLNLLYDVPSYTREETKGRKCLSFSLKELSVKASSLLSFGVSECL